MDRKNWLQIACAALVGVSWLPIAAQAQGAATSKLRSVAVLDFELIGEQNNPPSKAAQEIRLRNATLQLQRELVDRQLYRVVDAAPSDELQLTLRSQHEFLYDCDECAEQVGRLLGADLVVATRVQKASELILNLNLKIYDVMAQKVVFSKSVDMLGNEDASWTRAVRYLVRDMAEKR